MDKELKGIDRHLRNLRIPEVDNTTHEKALRRLLAAEIEPRYKPKNILAFPLIKYALPVAAVFILIFGLFFILRGVWRPESTVTVVSIQGTVYERTPVDTEAGKVLEQREYKKGTVFSSEEDSTLTCTMGKNTQMKLLESSQIELRALEYGDMAENSSLFLSKGKIECSVEMPGKDSLFEVLTDYTRIRVYGTKFSVEVLDNKDVVIKVHEGTVQVDNYYRAEDKVISIKETVSVIAKELGELFAAAEITIDKEQELQINNEQIATRNNRVQDLLDQILDVHLNPDIDKREKEISFRRILADIKEVIDPEAFTPNGLQGDAEVKSKDEPKAELSGSAADSEASRAEAEEHKHRGTVYLPTNAGVEKGVGIPDGWYKSESADVFSWTDDAAHTGNKSIKIASATQSSKMYAWSYTLTENLPFGKQLTLKVFVKTEKVTGQGICLILRADDTRTPSGEAEMFVITQGIRIIRSSQDWTEYSLSFFQPLASDMKSITINLIYLPPTKGEVYFDDITLSYEE
ncbi:MAG: FecR domain-containing protein [Spirochaetales bacterium]|nr:FecR domain-containing protein [Spirochaetales bacterium]